MERKLFDTDVIIDYLRGNKKAIQLFESYEGDFCISAISIAELHSGLKGEKEERDLDYFLSLFTIYPVTEEIAIAGGKLRNKWYQSHGMGLADALIAATANIHGMKLISLNSKHFGMLESLEVPYKK
jgi:predicted nucleic acid-binding protein